MDPKEIMKGYGVSLLPDRPVEAMAYVPFQPYTPALCKPVLGYENGTLFTDLHKPFYGRKCRGDRNE